MDVSVIIVNYNTCKMTNECIDSIFENTKYITFEIILIDNASIDESKVVFEKDDRIKYIYNQMNIGFGQANNIGLEIAIGRNVLFLNSDTLLINNAIKILSDFLDENNDAGACGGNMYNLHQKPSHSFGHFYPSILWEINILSYNFLAKILYGKNADHNFSNRILEVAHIIGADLMVKKEVLEKIGGFDSHFFMYREETELCYRISNMGYKLYSVPQAKIIHLEGKSVKKTTLEHKKVKWMLESNRTFLEMYHSKVYVYIAISIYKITVYTRIFMCGIFNKDRKNYWCTVKDILKSI